ncbi:MAG: class I SAM-dependent methyltransferase [Pseudomonadota bacterium]
MNLIRNNFNTTEGLSVLDLGCGPRDQAVPLRHLGVNYVGVDYSNGDADMLADAHALPFAEASFDVVLSYAVLEHLHNPFLAVSEVARILRPGGYYMGTVSQGEPFHSSYFHHTAWGVVSVVAAVSELELLRLWSARGTLDALGKMAPYSRAIRLPLRMLGFAEANPALLSPTWKSATPEKRAEIKLMQAGSIGFCVRKKGTFSGRFRD